MPFDPASIRWPPSLLNDRPALAALLIVPAALAAVVFTPLTDRPAPTTARWARATLGVLFVGYVAAVVAVILWPFPADTVEVCKPHRIAPGPQLVPFHFLAKARWNWVFVTRRAAVRELVEPVANVVLFVPLGLYLGFVARWRASVILAVGVGCSLVLELTQLTGVWGAYACAYRRFDVDDVITNGAGAAAGAAMALVFYRSWSHVDHRLFPSDK